MDTAVVGNRSKTRLLVMLHHAARIDNMVCIGRQLLSTISSSVTPRAGGGHVKSGMIDFVWCQSNHLT
jgi:hypothetical protein